MTNVIIPIRNREDNKKEFLKFFSELSQEYNLFLVEQDNEHAFNRGILKNIGYIESNKIKPAEFLLFNDIDNIPKELNVKLCFEKGVIKHLYGHNFSLGGIFSVDYETFKTINGFPNDYWGWGVEDVALQNRAIKNKIKIDRSCFIERDKSKELSHLDEYSSIPMEKRYSWQISWDKYKKEIVTNSSTGLNDISYKLNKIEQITDNVFLLKCDFTRGYKILKYEYKDTVPNIGDAIQSIALEKFLSKYNISVEGYYHRNDMHNDMIINGHHRTSNFIKQEEKLPKRAIFLGIHSEEKLLRNIEKGTLVGARDIFTIKEIEKANDLIPLFTGCVTSTFDIYNGERKEERDMFHWRGYDAPKNISWDMQLAFANKLLDIIKTSKLIKTDRLHVAIPAIAFGTPVILTPRNFQVERYSVFDFFKEFPGFGKLIDTSTGLREIMRDRFHYAFGKIHANYLSK